MTVLIALIVVATLINIIAIILISQYLRGMNKKLDIVSTETHENKRSVEAVAQEANEDNERLRFLIDAHNKNVTALDDTPSKADFERLRCYVFNNVESKYEAKHAATGSLDKKCLVAQMQDPTFHRGMIVDGWKETEDDA